MIAAITLQFNQSGEVGLTEAAARQLVTSLRRMADQGDRLAAENGIAAAAMQFKLFDVHECTWTAAYAREAADRVEVALTESQRHLAQKGRPLRRHDHITRDKDGFMVEIHSEYEF